MRNLRKLCPLLCLIILPCVSIADGHESKPNANRSKNRRRPEGPSMNMRSICGVNHTALTYSARTDWLLAGAPEIRTTRFSSSAIRPVPISMGPWMVSTVAATAHPPVASDRPVGLMSISDSRACRKPRPGDRNEIASSKLVLPAPFEPVAITGTGSRSSASDL